MPQKPGCTRNASAASASDPPTTPLDLALLVPGDVYFAELAQAWQTFTADARRQVMALVRPLKGKAWACARMPVARASRTLARFSGSGVGRQPPGGRTRRNRADAAVVNRDYPPARADETEGFFRDVAGELDGGVGGLDELVRPQPCPPQFLVER